VATSYDGTLFLREDPVDGATAQEVLRRASTLDAADVVLEWHQWNVHRASADCAASWTSLVDDELDRTRRRLGDAPDGDALRAPAFPRDPERLEAWLLRWEEDYRPTTACESLDHHLAWTPVVEPCAVALVPTDHPTDALAYTGFFGAYGPSGLPGLIAVARDWSARYGAELVTNWGTMLWFAVSRPPEDIDDAFRLAHEHTVLAPCTTILPGVSTRDHARALLGRDRWFLHERP
jgi:hypothetical protein